MSVDSGTEHAAAARDWSDRLAGAGEALARGWTLWRADLRDVWQTAGDGIERLRGRWLTARLLETGCLDIRDAAGEPVKRAPRGRCADLILPLSGGALIRTVTLPRATRRHLDRVLYHQLGRLTPYPPDRAVFDYRVTGRPAPDQIAVDIAVLPHTTYQAALDAAAVQGLAVRRVTIDGAQGPAPFDLLNPDDRLAVPRRHRPGLRLAGAIAGAVLGFAVINLLGAAILLAVFHAQAPTARSAAEDAAALRLQVEALGGSSRVLAAEKAGVVPMVAVMDALSRLLPDGTWLTTLEVEDGAVAIQGNTRDAAALLALIDQSPVFLDPAFAGPVSRSGSGGERFQIRVILANPAPRPDEGAP